MGRFIDCQISVAPWGTRAKFRRAKVGLLRKSSTIYIAIFSHLNDNFKFPINENSIELLPAAIRFKDLEKDLFIRDANDEQRYETMMREIKVLLKKDKLKQNGKSEMLDKFINSIPPFSSYNPKDLIPRRGTRPLLIGDHSSLINQQATNVSRDYGPDDAIDGSDDNQNCTLTNSSNADPNLNITKCHSIIVTKPTTTTQINGKPLKYQQLDNEQLKLIKIRGLEKLPRELWLLNSLHELTLTECNLTSVPKQLEKFSSSLHFLDLSRNRIDKLPRTFCCKMNNLELLNLSHNQIETLPIEIKFFCRLADLNISNNLLRMLPSTFSDLKSLRKLVVANNNLSQLPAFRRDDIRLKYLDVSYNPLDGASNEASTFEVYPSYDDGLGYNENLFCPLTPIPKNKFPTLFEISMLRVVRSDGLLKLASEESLPRTIVSTMQRDIFKCFKCNKLNILPAYNSTDILDYVQQVEVLLASRNYTHGMTFMKLLCRSCFDNMSS